MASEVQAPKRKLLSLPGMVRSVSAEARKAEGPFYNKPPEAVADQVRSISTPDLVPLNEQWRELRDKCEADHEKGDRDRRKVFEDACKKAADRGRATVDVNLQPESLAALARALEPWMSEAALKRYAATNVQGVRYNIGQVAHIIAAELEDRYQRDPSLRPAEQQAALKEAADAESEMLDLNRTLKEQQTKYQSASSLLRGPLNVLIQRTQSAIAETEQRRQAAIRTAQRYSAVVVS